MGGEASVGGGEGDSGEEGETRRKHKGGIKGRNV